MKHIRSSIILTGLPGAGKTTTGNILASTLKLPLIDADQAIAEKTGMAINEIFRRFGEPCFRAHETAFLEELVSRQSENRPPFILSCGGGMVISAYNRSLLKKLGKVFYLAVAMDLLANRLLDDPPRAGLGLKERAYAASKQETSKNRQAELQKIRESLDKIMVTRSSFYAEADFTIDTTDYEPQAVARQILAFFPDSPLTSACSL